MNAEMARLQLQQMKTVFEDIKEEYEAVNRKKTDNNITTTTNVTKRQQ